MRAPRIFSMDKLSANGWHVLGLFVAGIVVRWGWEVGGFLWTKIVY